MNNSATQGLYKVNILLPLCNWSVWNMPFINAGHNWAPDVQGKLIVCVFF